MGDIGSLSIGAIIAVLAIIVKEKLLIPVICGIFLIENLSVIIQVTYFKYTKKKYGEGKKDFPHVTTTPPLSEKNSRNKNCSKVLDGWYLISQLYP